MDENSLYVSIQLISPASGELISYPSRGGSLCSFHSINFPSEWGAKDSIRVHGVLCRVSIQLISPASGEDLAEEETLVGNLVSIQLISPASGETLMSTARLAALRGFHSINFPSEWGGLECIWI